MSDDLFSLRDLLAVFIAGGITIGILQRLWLHARFEALQVLTWRYRRTSWAEMCVPETLRPHAHRLGWWAELAQHLRQPTPDLTASPAFAREVPPALAAAVAPSGGRHALRTVAAAAPDVEPAVDDDGAGPAPTVPVADPVELVLLPLQIPDDEEGDELTTIRPDRPDWAEGTDAYRPGIEPADELAARRIRIGIDREAIAPLAAELLATIDWPSLDTIRVRSRRPARRPARRVDPRLAAMRLLVAQANHDAAHRYADSPLVCAA